MTRIIALILVATAGLHFSTHPADAKQKHCPPGLAKKNPACVPPGLAKKGVTEDEFRNQPREVLETGDIVRIDGVDYIIVQTRSGPVLRRGDDFYRLPRDVTGEFVRIGDVLVRVDPTTKAVIDLVRIADLILS